MGLDEQISIRLTEADMRRLEALAGRIPNMKRLAIARAALLIGLAEVEADPIRLLEASPGGPQEDPPLQTTRSRRGRR